MPDIDLEPHEFADRDPQSGKWRRPISKKAARNWFLAALAPLIFIGVNANQLQPSTLFGCATMFAFCAGVFAAYWLRDLY